MNDVLRTLRAHRSVRQFSSTPVPEAAIAEAVRAAQQTSTSSWVQAYCLLQVEDPEERARLRELTGDQPQVEEAGAFFCICGDTRRHRLVAERAGVPCAQNLETFLLAVIDATLFAQSLTLAFESQGFGICYIGGLRSHVTEVDRLLEIPHGVFPLYGLCVGAPADELAAERPRRPRLPVEAVWMRGRYASDEQVTEHLAALDRDSGEYYSERGQPGRDWSGGTWRKFRRPAREDLARYYRSKGAILE